MRADRGLHRWLLGGITVCLGAMSLLLWALYTPRMPLLLAAPHVTLLPAREQFNGYRNYYDAATLPDGKLVYKRVMGYRHLFTCFDPRMGKEQPFIPANRSTSIRSYSRPYALSPDGKWLLVEGGSIWDGFMALTVNGPSITIGKKPWQSLQPGDDFAVVSNPLWIPDSRKWVVLTFNSANGINAELGSIHPPGILKRIPGGHPRGTQEWDSVGARLLGQTRPGRMLALATVDAADNPKTSRRIHFFSFNIGPGTTDLNQYAVSLPKSGVQDRDAMGGLEQLQEAVTLSSDGNRLAWLIIVGTQPSPIVQTLSQWIPWLPAHRPDPPALQLRLSRTDGTAMRVLASMPLSSVTDYESLRRAELPYDLQWAPDNKHLNFIYHDGLYTVPAD